jgi:MiaB/RimO family radical SAM methylthiotransferase
MFISGCGAFKDWRAQENFFELYPELKEFSEKIIILWEDPDEVDIKNWQKILTVKQKQISKDKIKSISKSLTGLYTKKFILIQWGCDSFCTFCLTVVKRWRHFSRSKEDILEDILDFEKQWWKEVVLTWINLAAWGLDSTNNIWESRLAELLEYLLENSNIPRIRISSMWPEFIDDKCFEVFKNTRIYPHFHYSVQSWSSSVLKNMKRHYNWEHLRNVLKKTMNLKREDWVKISIWADIIVWFPWETSEDFKESLDLIKNYWLKKVHAFPFSWHELWENVPAWKFEEQIDWKIKKERMWEIMNLSDEIRDDFIDENIWETLEVLIEVVNWKKCALNDSEEVPLGRKWWTQNYIEANESNFEIISWKVAKNEIVIWKLIK